MYLMDELESSLAASEPRRVHSLLMDDVLLVGDRIALLLSEDLLLLVDNGAVATTLLRDDRAKGLWKQNIMNFLTDPAADLLDSSCKTLPTRAYESPRVGLPSVSTSVARTRSVSDRRQRFTLLFLL